MAEADTITPPPPPTLRRRNSFPTSVLIPTKLTLPSKPLHTASLPPPPSNGNVLPPPLDFELLSLKPTLSYTSLKDLLPSTAVNSPKSAATPAAHGGSAYEISIRNRLVKQAAWAYLQPMSPFPDSSSHHFLRRFWLRFCTRNPIVDCLRFIRLHVIPTITGAFDRFLRAIRVRTSR